MSIEKLILHHYLVRETQHWVKEVWTFLDLELTLTLGDNLLIINIFGECDVNIPEI
mgnify:CR=1 FL=1